MSVTSLACGVVAVSKHGGNKRETEELWVAPRWGGVSMTGLSEIPNRWTQKAGEMESFTSSLPNGAKYMT